MEMPINIMCLLTVGLKTLILRFVTANCVVSNKMAVSSTEQVGCVMNIPMFYISQLQY